ncbi:MAG: hypothetical protein OQJ84_07605 [Xanthomonadales bacterium]|nr:hypothetical protein [Xanthomonadales bacterium]
MVNLTSIDHLDHTQNIVATSLDRPRIACLTRLSRAIDDLVESDCCEGARQLHPHPRKTDCP